MDAFELRKKIGINTKNTGKRLVDLASEDDDARLTARELVEHNASRDLAGKIFIEIAREEERKESTVGWRRMKEITEKVMKKGCFTVEDVRYDLEKLRETYEDELVQYFVVNSDLNMSAGKNCRSSSSCS